MRIAVVENEQEERQHICSCIAEYFQRKDMAADVCTYEDGDEIVNGARTPFDVIFMDIDMEGIDGLEAARRIRTYDFNVMIVFITNMAGYVTLVFYLVKDICKMALLDVASPVLSVAVMKEPWLNAGSMAVCILMQFLILRKIEPVIRMDGQLRLRKMDLAVVFFPAVPYAIINQEQERIREINKIYHDISVSSKEVWGRG